MQENLVTIAVFHSQPEFLLARTRLESADIECFAYDENMFPPLPSFTREADSPLNPEGNCAPLECLGLVVS